MLINFELNQILKKINGGFICVLGEKTEAFSTVEEFEHSDFEKNCIVVSIRSQENVIVLELKPFKIPRADSNAAWLKNQDSLSMEPSFF